MRSVRKTATRKMVTKEPTNTTIKIREDAGVLSIVLPSNYRPLAPSTLVKNGRLILEPGKSYLLRTRLADYVKMNYNQWII